MSSEIPINQLVEFVQTAITRADRLETTLPPEVFEITGMSSRKIRILLNELCKLPKTRYLEVGCWQGSTLIAALHGNSKTVECALACDNFKAHGGPREQFHGNVKQFLAPYDNDRFKFYEMDCWELATKLSERGVTVYFYDGEHTEEDQYKALTNFNTVFADVFVCLIDDANHPPVVPASRRAFRDLSYQIVYEKVLPARWNGDVENWWNGLLVSVVKRVKSLQ